jgi:putative transposase
VFSTKYRRPVLTEDIEKRLKELVQEIAKDKGFEVAQIEVGEQDHVHIFASAHPKMSPSLIVKYIKGITARKLFIEFPELKNRLRKGHLWNPSYYIETIGSISEDAIKKYIENQRKGL